MTPKQIVLMLVAAMLFIVALAACKTQTVRSVAGAVKVGAQSFKDEVASDEATDDISADEAAFLNPLIDEIGAAADRVLASSVNWSQMSNADKVEIAHMAVTQIGDAVERLSEKGVGLKSPKAQQRFETYLRDARLAVDALKIIEASLPQPSPTPTPGG
ncbi:MAG TPA: hypothetical protein VFA21_20470 [Pyrinomonadaceae bacterium]|nr:hypothetical protein [Pyrinomonadaceae bacterium]